MTMNDDPSKCFNRKFLYRFSFTIYLFFQLYSVISSRMMHSSLDFVTEKAQMLTQESRDCLASDITQQNLDNILIGLIGAFHECLPSTTVITASESVGCILFFLADMLY
jgi:hypothetical protein